MSNHSFNVINFDIERYSKDKKTIADELGYNTLNKLMSACKMSLGEDEKTIPVKWFKLQFFTNGFSFVTDKELDGLYAFYGGLGGEPDAYNQPTEIAIANPYLKYNKTLNIKDDGVLISFDTMRRGIIPVIGKYAGLLAENTITMRICDIMARITNIISGGDDATIESALEYLKQIEDGKLGIIEESPFLQDLKVQAGASEGGKTRLTDLIEVEQYLKASLYNEIGLQANYNMKRESINSNEAQLNDDMIQPYIDDAMENLKRGFDEVNKKYGREWTIEFGSAWEENESVREAEEKTIEAEAEKTEAETEQIIIETKNLEEGGNDDESNGETDNQTNISTTGGRPNDEPEEQEDGELDNGDDNGGRDDTGQDDPDKVREEES